MTFWHWLVDNMFWSCVTATYVLGTFKYYRLVDTTWWVVFSPVLAYVVLLIALLLILWWRIT